MIRAKLPKNTIGQGGPWPLSDDLMHYLTRVHRLAENATVIAFDGTGLECEARLFKQDGHWLLEATESPREGLQGTEVTVWYGLPKGDKLERVTRQLTELGVGGLILISCQRSVVRLEPKRAEKRIARLTRIAEEATRQSGRADSLTIHGPQTIAEALKSNALDTLIVFDPTGNQQLDELELHGTIGAVVGPEGGFTADELDALNDAGAHCVRLGHLVLRTETAAPVAAALVLHRLGHI